MSDFKLYVHIVPNNKLYIGITSYTLAHRFGNEGSGYMKNVRFYKAIQKYGWDNIQHILLLEHLDKATAEECEKYLILKYKTTNAEFGYNISAGGECGHYGCKASDELRERLSDIHKDIGFTEAQYEAFFGNNYWQGRHLTNEHKQKIREKAIGRKHTEETKQKLSELKKGKPSPRKGKHLSDETKEKLRQANLGKKASDETKAKLKGLHSGENHWTYGKPRSEETKRKISETLKRRALERREQSGS